MMKRRTLIANSAGYIFWGIQSKAKLNSVSVVNNTKMGRIVHVFIDASVDKQGNYAAGINVPKWGLIDVYLGQGTVLGSTYAEFNNLVYVCNKYLPEVKGRKYIIHIDCVEVFNKKFPRDDLTYVKEKGHGAETPLDFKVIDMSTRALLKASKIVTIDKEITAKVIFNAVKIVYNKPELKLDGKVADGANGLFKIDGKCIREFYTN